MWSTDSRPFILDSESLETILRAYILISGVQAFGVVHKIIILGSGVVKAGFAGEEAPRSVFPCITGVPKEQSVMMTSSKNKYVGELAEKKR